MARKTAPKPVDELACAFCKDVKGLDLSDFKKHRADVHGDPDAGHLKMKTLMHLDGTDFYAWTYEILDGEQVVGSRYVSQPRKGLDKAMWDEAG